MVDEKIKGYGAGTVETVISFEKIAEESKKIIFQQAGRETPGRDN